jgi:hypothetical protein
MSGTDVQRITPGAQSGGTRAGDSPGLYGGTRRVASCDPARLVAFLRANPDKARAWAGAHRISPNDIQTFVSRLTPVLLRADTLVTNHGYRNGKATSAPAVLQAGMGVLVDRHGVPTVKCNCGNPLTRPEKKISTGNASYNGRSWPGFSKKKVTRVQPRSDAKGEVTAFVLVDPGATMGFTRPTATTGAADGPPTALPSTELPGAGGTPGTADPSADPSGEPSTGPSATDPSTGPSAGVVDPSGTGSSTPGDGTGTGTGGQDGTSGDGYPQEQGSTTPSQSGSDTGSDTGSNMSTQGTQPGGDGSGASGGSTYGTDASTGSAGSAGSGDEPAVSPS